MGKTSKLSSLSFRVAIATFRCCILCGLGTAMAWSQENPLREFEPSYLQRVLPNVQNLQSQTEATSSELRTSTERWLQASQTGTETCLAESNPPPAPDDASIFSVNASGTNAMLKASPTTNSSSPTTNLSTGSGDQQTTPNQNRPFAGVESLQLSSTMQKIILNTILVIAAAVTLIVVLRKGWPHQKAISKSPVSTLKVEQTLGLGGKSTLKVVRCGINQILVAIDGGGIKSVVALEPSLDVENEILATSPEPKSQHPIQEPVNIEQFVKLIKEMESDILGDRRPGDRLRPSRV